MAIKRSVITGVGSYIPTIIKKNDEFNQHRFFAEDRNPIATTGEEIVRKFEKITGIAERRYAPAELNTSDIATIAAQRAIEDSGVDPETFDQIILAQNFGNVVNGSIQTDAVPSLASRVKHDLGIRNPSCVAYDILFGCPGWVQGMIQADAFFKAGIAKKALVIGAETLSRVIDPFDRDSMIFSDGAGATILEYNEAEEEMGSGMLSSSAVSHCNEEAFYINMSSSYDPESDQSVRYLKMKGRKVYEYALKYVPEAMKDCFDKSGLNIKELKKIFIHQANEKMDEAIVQAFLKLYDLKYAPTEIMPMCIQFLGNSSVATIPTLYDLVLKGGFDDHVLTKGDVVLFASVGAGMNINAICYRI